MNHVLDEKIQRFMTLFGVEPDYTLEELARSYRILARMNHPDVSRDVTSEMRMVLVNEGYEVLKRLYEEREALTPSAGSEVSKEKTEDPVYRQYRRAYDIMKDAFEDYYGESGRRFTGREDLLRERLTLAKSEFSRVLNDFDYNPWVDDSIDRINSINKWLI